MTLSLKSGITVMTICLLLLASNTSWAVIYVNANSTSLEPDGESWQSAYRTIQDALNVAQTDDEIWVAEGTYSGEIRLEKNIGLYGGFCGSEEHRSQRNWQLYETILNEYMDIFIGDQARIDGFTVKIYDLYCLHGSPVVQNNRFLNTGIQCYNSSAIITHNKFIASNHAYCAIRCESGSPTIAGNLITGYSIYALWSNNSSPIVINNTIAGNGAAICWNNKGAPIIVNNIVAFNVHGGIYIGFDTYTPLMNNNLVYGNGIDYSGVIPGKDDISEDPCFVSLEFGDFHIQPNSPCKNMGCSDYLSLLQTDLDGSQRVCGRSVDIGAYECDGKHRKVNQRIVYVNCNAAEGGNGTCWAAAYKSIQSAIDDVAANGGAEIWVAKGTYNETVRPVTFSNLYGGFAGYESMLDERDWRQNECIITNPVANAVDFWSNLCRLDGFTVTDSIIGIACWFSSAVIVNNKINNNWIAIGIDSSAPVIEKNEINNNEWGIRCQSLGGTRISGNLVMRNNIGIYCSNVSSCIMTNNTIVENNQVGAFIINVPEEGNVYFINNIVTFNNCGLGIFYSDPESVKQFSNNIYGNLNGDSNSGPFAENMSIDPMFVDLDNGDYHLKRWSPCIDAGSNLAPSLTKTDIDDQSRIHGKSVDIGADEYWPSKSKISKFQKVFFTLD